MADTARKGLARGVVEEIPKLAKRVGELEQRIEQLEQQLRETRQDDGTWDHSSQRRLSMCGRPSTCTLVAWGPRSPSSSAKRTAVPTSSPSKGSSSTAFRWK